jgi:hypothetical protein
MAEYLLAWNDMKSILTAWLAFDRGALHALAGLGLMLFCALVTRRPVSSFIPWLLVLLLEIANETASGYADGVLEDWEIVGSRQDLVTVMIAPTVLLLAARLMPSLFVRRTGVRVPQEVMPEEERADVIEDAEFVELDASFSPKPEATARRP